MAYDLPWLICGTNNLFILRSLCLSCMLQADSNAAFATFMTWLSSVGQPRTYATPEETATRKAAFVHAAQVAATFNNRPGSKAFVSGGLLLACSCVAAWSYTAIDQQPDPPSPCF